MSSALTLEEFRASGRDSNLQLEFPRQDFYYECGRMYAGDSCYIEKTDEGWYLTIERSEYESKDLAELEEILYREWYLPEIAGVSG